MKINLSTTIKCMCVYGTRISFIDFDDAKKVIFGTVCELALLYFSVARGREKDHLVVSFESHLATVFGMVNAFQTSSK